MLNLNVPYIQQMLDVGGVDGDWACGPVSVAMVLAYYGKLDPWGDYIAGQPARDLAGAHPISTPTGRGSTPRGTSSAALDFAPYVTNVYTSNGHLYGALAPGPRGEAVAGLYGTICPTGFADWSLMQSVFEWNGLKAQQIPTGWGDITAALRREHPVLLGNDLTPQGHVLVATGYTANNQLIVNDPFGNRLAAGYGANSGKAVVYPWACARAQVALEVTGTYPPPPRPTRTPTPSPTEDIAGSHTFSALSLLVWEAPTAVRSRTTGRGDALREGESSLAPSDRQESPGRPAVPPGPARTQAPSQGVPQPDRRLWGLTWLVLMAGYVLVSVPRAAATEAARREHAERTPPKREK